MTEQGVASAASKSVSFAVWSGKIWRKLQSAIRYLPFFGHLPNCTLKDHASALKEFVPTIIFGTATFWMTALMLKAFSAYEHYKISSLLLETTNAGQLFIFSVGMLGPILIVSATDPPGTKQFPGRLAHFTLIVVLGSLASGFYAIALASRQNDEMLNIVNGSYIYAASLAISAFVVTMRYLTTVYRKNTQSADAESLLKAPEKEFADEFNSRHPTDPLGSASSSGVDAMVNRFNNGGAP